MIKECCNTCQHNMDCNAPDDQLGVCQDYELAKDTVEDYIYSHGYNKESECDK